MEVGGLSLAFQGVAQEKGRAAAVCTEQKEGFDRAFDPKSERCRSGPRPHRVREQARRQERMLDVEHREWMICLGRGFLHTPNQALIIGP